LILFPIVFADIRGLRARGSVHTRPKGLVVENGAEIAAPVQSNNN